MPYLYWSSLQGVSDYLSAWFADEDAAAAPPSGERQAQPPPVEPQPERDDEARKIPERHNRSCYGVALARDTPLQDDDAPPFVFDTMKDVLHFCKRYKTSGPRWKRFPNRRSAERFSVDAFDYEPDGVDGHGGVDRESLPFRAPSPQELVQLRKFIEDGEIDEVRRTIETNPRYLIGSGDNPTVLQEGCRYNAFHIAAKANQADIMKLILGKLQSENYVRQLYPADDPRTTRDRIAYIVDLYLNMPDKTRKGETALHFATKFGSVSSVAFLLSQDACDRDACNCDGYSADEIICERGGGEAETRKIEELFEEQVVIPVLRRQDGDGVPLISTPVSIKNLQTLLSPTESACQKKLCGYVGPLPAPRALKLMIDLQEAKFTRHAVELRKLDVDKGLESVVRNIARKHKVPWCEYWPFLDHAVDITSGDGLRALNTYLDGRTYIYGGSPTKADFHVWSAMSPILKFVDEGVAFRNIQRWIRAMRKFNPTQMLTWRTPKPTQPMPASAQPETDACLVNLINRFHLEGEF